MHAIGPYRFTEQDIERTLRNGRTLFDLLPGGFPPDPAGPAAPHRRRVEAVLDGIAADDPTAALDVLWEEWFAAVQALRLRGAFGAPAVGSVAGLFTGSGGVPKLPRPSFEVGWGGADGDRQGDRANHGRPWQALCLWSAEVVARFAAEGHLSCPRT